MTVCALESSRNYRILDRTWEFNYTRPIYSTMRPLEFDYWRGISVSSLGKLVGNMVNGFLELLDCIFSAFASH